jgi:hypothetical protein
VFKFIKLLILAALIAGAVIMWRSHKSGDPTAKGITDKVVDEVTGNRAYKQGEQIKKKLEVIGNRQQQRYDNIMESVKE